MEFIKIRTKLGITTAILSVCSFIVSTKIMQASAQLPDHLYAPHTGIIHQTPERVTLVPLDTQR
jgi:hypothetical protein